MSSPSASAGLLPVRLLPLQLTPSGRPVLLPGEAERLIQDKADLVFIATQQEEEEEEGKNAALLEDGVLRVTTHRVLWVDPKKAFPGSSSSAAAFSVPLSCIAKCELKATRLWSSQKTRLHLACDPGNKRTLVEVSTLFGTADPQRSREKSSSSPPRSFSSQPFLREVKVVAPNQSAIHSAVQASLAAREWEKMAEGGGAGATGNASLSPSSPPPQVDEALVAVVVSMGFSASDASEALAATGGHDAQEAALWLLERDAKEKLPSSSSSDDKKRRPPPPSSPPSSSAALASGVGVGGLLRREERAAAAADAAVEAAFSDLGALMRAAAEMVELAKKYREEARARDERRRRQHDSSSSSSTTATAIDEADGSEADFEDELALLGVIASPVTRAATAAEEPSSSSSSFSSSSSSTSSTFRFPFATKKSSSASSTKSQSSNISLYIRELSAELSDFCQPLVAAAGGVLPLPDVYCLYNRARGSELAAPLDVVAAAEAWGRLSSSSPLRLRRLGEDGDVLAVVSADQCDDAVVCELLAALARDDEEEENGDGGADGKEKKPRRVSASTVAAARARLLPSESIPGLGRPLTPSDVAAAMRVPLAVAAAHLATAERGRALCRDDGDQGVQYFANFFDSYRASSCSSSSSSASSAPAA